MSKERGYQCHICTGCGRCVDKAAEIRVLTHSFLLGKEEFPADNSDAGFVLVDLGTTTIALEYYGGNGKKQAEFVSLNPQRSFGADVISRLEQANNLIHRKEMQALVMNKIKEGIHSFVEQGLPIRKIYLAGNTVMTYLFLGWDTKELESAPFKATYLGAYEREVEGIPLVTVPGISAFVGGDVLAGVLAADMPLKEEISLLIDLGTNGEMVLGNKEKLLATATAAGPAFEGRSDLWGSDRVKLLAALLDQEILDETGLLVDPYFEKGVVIEKALITQDMVREFQLAKAAIHAGVLCLQEEYGLEDLGQIGTVYLAGGFGYYLDVESAFRVGLFPGALRGKVKSVGNTALAGLYSIAMRESRGEDVFGQIEANTKPGMETINLAMNPNFPDYYIEKMNLIPE